MEPKYNLLEQTDLESPSDIHPPALLDPRSAKHSSRASPRTVILTLLVVAVNIACLVSTWKQMDTTHLALSRQLDFRDTRDLPRPNTDTYLGEY